MMYSKYSKSLTFSLSEEVYQKIENESDKQQISKAEFVRNLLTEGLKTTGVKTNEEQE